jgi:hypothetical protein
VADSHELQLLCVKSVICVMTPGCSRLKNSAPDRFRAVMAAGECVRLMRLKRLKSPQGQVADSHEVQLLCVMSVMCVMTPGYRSHLNHSKRCFQLPNDQTGAMELARSV